LGKRRDRIGNHFEDGIAIVTGGSSGMGRALCEELGRRKAVVVVADIEREGAEQTASRVVSQGGRAGAVGLDVSKETEVRGLIEETVQEHGRLDFLFNNAGIAIQGEARDMTAEHWNRIIEVNLMGVLYGTTAAYGIMVRQGSGHIINTASIAGLIGMALTVAYATTKHGVVGLSTSLRAEGAELGVKVTVVCPGPVNTNIFDSATMVKATNEDFFGRMPERLMVDPEKAARIILEGVVHNRAIIVFPGYTRFFWRITRLHPLLYAPINRMVTLDFRKSIRQD